jgi:hypothetical protein
MMWHDLKCEHLHLSLQIVTFAHFISNRNEIFLQADVNFVPPYSMVLLCKIQLSKLDCTNFLLHFVPISIGKCTCLIFFTHKIS